MHFFYGRPARPGYELTYEDFVGMEQNNAMLLVRGAAPHLMAMGAYSDRPLDASWGDALADDPAEGAAMVHEANVERSKARSMKNRRPAF